MNFMELYGGKIDDVERYDAIYDSILYWAYVGEDVWACRTGAYLWNGGFRGRSAFFLTLLWYPAYSGT